MLLGMGPRILHVQGLALASAFLGEGAWRGTRSPGVEWLPLSQPDAPDATVLIRMRPGSSYPAHRHVGVEEVLVLAGGYRDDWGAHAAGTWLAYPAGSMHAPVALGDATLPVGPDNPACVLYAVARGGVRNLEASQPAPGTSRVHNETP
jgi:anti-sigma factor ChrR (cupin superfamily)